MNEEFVKNIYKNIVEDGCDIYKNLYDNTEITEYTVDYWKDALNLYHSLDENQKTVFMNIVKQTIVDTISSLFAVLDGSGSLSDNIDIKINGHSTEDELQDNFLALIEKKSIL